MVIINIKLLDLDGNPLANKTIYLEYIDLDDCIFVENKKSSCLLFWSMLLLQLKDSVGGYMRFLKVLCLALFLSLMIVGNTWADADRNKMSEDNKTPTEITCPNGYRYNKQTKKCVSKYEVNKSTIKINRKSRKSRKNINKQ